MRHGLILSLIITLTAMTLTGCGKKGAPHSPGGPGEQIFPRDYPVE